MTNYKQTPHTAVGPAASPLDAGSGNTYGAFSMRVCSPSPTSVVNLETSPDGTTWTVMGSVTGDGWVTARTDHRQRQARTNVTNMGGATGISAIVVSGP